jgi:hypothetical protein
MLWTWLLPDVPRPLDEERWVRQGGKWIVFARRDLLVSLGRNLAPYIDAGEVPSAKYWNEDPGAICVYSLGTHREKTRRLLDELGAPASMVWEYDYAWDKNIKSPFSFLYSQASKMRTILQSYGIAGTLRLVREVLRSGGG